MLRKPRTETFTYFIRLSVSAFYCQTLNDFIRESGNHFCYLLEKDMVDDHWSWGSDCRQTQIVALSFAQKLRVTEMLSKLNQIDFNKKERVGQRLNFKLQYSH